MFSTGKMSEETGHFLLLESLSLIMLYHLLITFCLMCFSFIYFLLFHMHRRGQEKEAIYVHILISLDLQSVFTALFMSLIKAAALEFSVKVKLLFVHLFVHQFVHSFIYLGLLFILQLLYFMEVSRLHYKCSSYFALLVHHSIHDTKHLVQRSKKTLMES